MAVGFTEKERKQITAALKAEGRKCAVAVGVRKTTVDQLARAADISKGAFYGFYASKELLFFEILEDLHTEVYQAAGEALRKTAALPTAQQAAQGVLAACTCMERSGLMDFLEQDVPYLLRKLPEDVLAAHYHSDEVHIRELLEKADLHPHGGTALAAATVRGLMLTVSHRQDIGEAYPQVLTVLVEGACQKLFS